MRVKVRQNSKTGIITPENEVLVLWKSDSDDERPGEADWGGGKAKRRERKKPWLTAVRELREEIGWYVSPNQLIPLTVDERQKDGVLHVSHLYLLLLEHAPPEVITSKEHKGFDYVPLPTFIDERMMSDKYIAALQNNPQVLDRMMQQAVYLEPVAV